MGCAWCARLLVSVRVRSGGFRLDVLLGGVACVVWWWCWRSVWGSWWLSWRGFWRSAAWLVGGVVLGAGGLVWWRSVAGGAVAVRAAGGAGGRLCMDRAFMHRVTLCGDNSKMGIKATSSTVWYRYNRVSEVCIHGWWSSVYGFVSSWWSSVGVCGRPFAALRGLSSRFASSWSEVRRRCVRSSVLGSEGCRPCGVAGISCRRGVLRSAGGCSCCSIRAPSSVLTGWTASDSRRCGWVDGAGLGLGGWRSVGSAADGRLDLPAPR